MSWIADPYESLLGINRELRSRALAQIDRIGAMERNIRAVQHTHAEMFWRNTALSWALWGPPNAVSTPPREIPAALRDAFSMNGRAEIVESYLDCTYPDNWPVIYTDYQIDRFLERIRERKYFIYGMTDVWLWEAVERYPIRGLGVVNMGSLTPWYESNCIYFGAKPTTIDYNRIISRTQRIRTMTVADWEKDRPSFDMAWSISSFEHDGLGMYGDPLDPEGDLKTMKKMKRVVKPGGLLFLSVPVGRDRVLFNNARIYGRVRLPMLTEGWVQINTFGLQLEHMEGPGHIQPIIVLRND